MSDPTSARREESEGRPDPGDAGRPTPPPDGERCPPNPGERARYLLAATALSLARLAFVSAVPVVTLCLLVAVEALVGPRPTVVVVTATGEYAVPVTRALAVAVVVHLARRLYALNAD
jgi:hypothetical protein